MTTTSLPNLYSFRRCPYAMRARLALMASGARWVHREVKLSAKPQAMIDVSPKATVPVLVLNDGTVIDQSLDIMYWALQQNDPDQWLERDHADLIARNDGPFKQDLDRFKYPDRHDSDAMAHAQSGLVFLQDLDGRIAQHGQLCGTAMGLADAAIMPFVRQFAAVDGDWFDAQDLPHLKPWLHNHMQSPLFQSIMFRPVPWAEGDEPLLTGAA